MQENILVGSYNQQGTAGIYINNKQIKVSNPSFLLLNPPHLYAVSEDQNSVISSYEFSGDYKLEGQLSTQGRIACHISIDRTKRFLFVANYMSGDVAVFLLEKDGQLLKLINFLVHDGPSGVVPDRQEKPHPHCSIANYDNKAVFVSDLGTDYVYWYDFDAENSNIKVNQQKSLRLLGHGPRHLALSAANDNLLFLSCELQQKIVIMSTKGKLEQLSEVVVSQNLTYLSQIKYFVKAGQEFIAVGSRGDNEIIIYQLTKDSKSASLKQSTRKKVYNWPRHFNLNQAKTKLIVANQKDSIVSEYAYEAGQLNEIKKTSIATPAYVQYY